MTLRISYSLLTLCILSSAPCACMPDSKNIGETLSTGEQTGSATGAQTGTTDAATDGETTVEDATSDSGVDATTAGTTAETASTGAASTGAASTGAASTGDASTGDASTGDASTGDLTFPCGMMACDADTQYCSVTIPGIPDVEIMYSCVQIPGRCVDDPSCACLNDEQGPCQCAEDQGFTVTCALP